MNASLPQKLLLYDGECAVCNTTVQFLLDRDVKGTLHYAPLQGKLAAQVFKRHPELLSLDSLIFVVQNNGAEQIYVHSHSVLRALAELPSPWPALSVFRYVPRLITDSFYKAFAAMRYRVFGKVESCRIPKPEEVERFHE